MCQFLLRTIENSYDARNTQTIDGDIVKNSETSVNTDMTVAEMKEFLQQYSEKLGLSPYLTSLLPRNLKNDTQGKEMLDHLSYICGDGRVLLIGDRPKSRLPNNLRAFVLYPFGAADIQDLKTPFIATPYLELATSLGMRNPASIHGCTCHLTKTLIDQMIHWNHSYWHGMSHQSCSRTNFYVLYAAGVTHV